MEKRETYRRRKRTSEQTAAVLREPALLSTTTDGCALFDLTVPLLSHFQTQPRSCPTYDRSPINPTRAIIEDRPHHSDHRFCYTLTQLSLAPSPRFSLTNANAVYRLGVSIPLIFDTSIEQPEDSTPWAPYSNHSFSVIIR